MSAGRKSEVVEFKRKLDDWAWVINGTEAPKPTTELVLTKTT